MQYGHNFKIRLKNILNDKTQESWISHAWLVIHGPCMANYTLVSLGTGELVNMLTKPLVNMLVKSGEYVGPVTGERVGQVTGEHVD